MSKFVALFIALILLSGCQSASLQPSNQLSASIDDNWRLQGRLSVRAESQSHVLGIDWVQRDGASLINLSALFGITVARIEASKGVVRIESGDNVQVFRSGDQIIVGDDAAGLSLRVPWESLVYWVRGQVGPSGPAINEAGVASGDWLLRITDSGEDGPSLLIFEHPDVSLKLKVQQWSLQGNSPHHTEK